MTDWTGDDPNIQTQKSIVNMPVRGSLGLLHQTISKSSVLPSERLQSWSKHEVTKGIMMAADNMRPEATLLTGLRYNDIQCHAQFEYEMKREMLGMHSISWWTFKSIMQAKYP